MRSSLFPSAPQPDIVLASRKVAYHAHLFKKRTFQDDSYEDHVVAAVDEAVVQIIGRRNSLRFKKETRVLGELLYNVLTTGVGLQSPGEEHCLIHKVTRDGQRLSALRRGVFITCKVLIPYVIDRLSKREILMNLYSSRQMGGIPSTSEESCNSFGNMTNVVRNGWEMVKEWCQQNSNAIKNVMDLAKRCHMAFFYLSGSYYLISQTSVGIKLFNINGRYQKVPQYYILGLFLLFQILISSLLLKDDTTSVHDDRSSLSIPILESDGRPATELTNPTNLDNTQETLASTCPLCLSRCHHATSIACGHVFCWKCIAGWVQEKAECPLCRTETTLQDLVCIYHADY